MRSNGERAGGADDVIGFAINECSLGWVLLAQGSGGIRAILLGDSPDELSRDLQHRFPGVSLIHHDHGQSPSVTSVLALIEAPASGVDLPLDIRGTPFQQRVWQALRGIPGGTTATYSEIAHQIGSPRATRAVAQACAANSLAVAIPCHRVVRQDGNLSGYRWGIERKRILLDREASS